MIQLKFSTVRKRINFQFKLLIFIFIITVFIIHITKRPMPIFETNFQPNIEQITQILKDNWNLTLGKLIQTCQNFTYEAFRTTQ